MSSNTSSKARARRMTILPSAVVAVMLEQGHGRHHAPKDADGRGAGHRNTSLQLWLDLAAFDLLGELLHQLRNLLELGMHRERTPVGFERGLVLAELLHDGAEPGERPEMARLAHKHLMDVLDRADVILVVEVNRRTPVPGLDEIRLEIDDRVEELERDVELLLFDRGLDASHQQIAGVATGGKPERPDAVLDVFGALLGRRDLERLEQLVDIDEIGRASCRE